MDLPPSTKLDSKILLKGKNEIRITIYYSDWSEWLKIPECLSMWTYYHFVDIQLFIFEKKLLLSHIHKQNSYLYIFKTYEVNNIFCSYKGKLWQTLVTAALASLL